MNECCVDSQHQTLVTKASQAKSVLQDAIAEAGRLLQSFEQVSLAFKTCFSQWYMACWQLLHHVVSDFRWVAIGNSGWVEAQAT